ncbi:MAG: beta-lactamase family protein [Kofleriaceae bacterium]|nr:beta-lactamase family protein [Kofleriaceae bacterium]MCB9571371.1 beta-lactamase family protein [Kofleriaceae bacterium]
MDGTARLAGILDAAIANRWCSAAALQVGDAGREVLTLARGLTRTLPAPGVPVDADAIFDLASVTKPIVTTALAMVLASRGALDLDAAAATLVPQVDPRVRVLHLLGHVSGLPPHVKFFQRLRAGDLAGQTDARGALVHLAASTALARPPAEAAAYSDLGYITLGAALERAGGAPLEDLFARLVAGPLGLSRARFVDLRAPAATRPAWDAPVVATEIEADEGLIEGVVHDENCRAGGGVAGHAGLFAPVADVGRFGQAMLTLLGGADVGGIRADVARRFFTTRLDATSTWRLGWDTPSEAPGVSHAGERWPRDGGFGHHGFTGTALWLDATRGRWVALLTNRVHPSRHDERALRIKDLRRAVMDAVVDLLGPG